MIIYKILSDFITGLLIFLIFYELTNNLFYPGISNASLGQNQSPDSQSRRDINPVCVIPLTCPCLSAHTRNLIPLRISLVAALLFLFVCMAGSAQGAADVWKVHTPAHLGHYLYK